jgi:hypothetical protein
LFLLAFGAFAQSDRGTITGTVSDPSGAMIPAAKITLTNVDTGAKWETVTTETGNYTLPSLPVSTYKLSVEASGFSRYEQTNIRVQVAVTTRIDIALQVGQSTQAIEVVAESSMLKTESAEQSTTVSGDKINSLPINFGIGAGAIRNPLSFTQLTPGASISGWNTIKVNGAPSGTFRILFEGQESSSGLDARVSDEVQPSVETIAEFTLQTSNFAAEFGLVAGGLFNFTSKSGTNQFHGGAYTYFVNTVFNAGIPFTNNGKNEHVRPPKHLADGGFTVGGPVWIPKVYDGRNRTFFFWSWEKYRDRQNAYMGITTVPIDAYRSGDLSAMLTGRNLGTDFAGRPILQNAVYDPATTITDSSGRLVRTVFPNNVIPSSRIDPVSAKIMGEIPKPNLGSALVNNYSLSSPFRKLQTIPSIKIDHSFTSTARMSGYYSQQNTEKDVGQDGLPDPISIRRDLYIKSYTARFNYDQSLTPTLLLHMGAGFQRYRNPDATPPVIANYDSLGKLGLKGTPGTGFPRIGTLGDNVYGGMALAMGPTNRGLYLQVKPTAVTQLTWIRGNHTYKTGGEWKIDTFTNKSDIGLSPSLGFSSAVTGQPLYGQALPSGTGIGSNFATFLLGLYDSGSVGNSVDPQYRKSSWSMFVQDTWKISRKITFDYGIRYDLQKPMRELWRRTSTFRMDLVNPNANGLKGATLYEGTGTGRCNCTLVPTYAYAIAPRLGVAYQIDAKTILRAGWGLSYNTANNFGYVGSGNSLGMGFNSISFVAPQSGIEAGKLSNGLVWDPAVLYGASYDPGLRVVPNAAVQSSPSNIDPNGGRPPRTNQWNISIQREVARNLVLEGSYIGNRGVWFNAGSNLINYNTMPSSYYKTVGLDITNAADRTLLTSTITSSLAVQRGFTKPYANFPSSGTVIQALKPYPQFASIGATWAPLGRTWYDSFQFKATKRYSHGVDASLAYTFSKTLDNYEGNGEVFSRNSFKSLASDGRPQMLTISVNYTVQRYGFLKTNKVARAILADWNIGAVLQYQSGPFLAAPASNNSLGTYLPGASTRQFRVAGEPLYIKDLNCHCIDYTKDTVLNPKAWTDQAPGVFGSGAVYYSDFRGQRRPVESIAIGKRIPIRERMAFSIRGEFFNPLNRLELVSDPATGSPSNPPTYSNGLLTGGFGFMNYLAASTNNQNNTYPTVRTGQIVARFEF